MSIRKSKVVKVNISAGTYKDEAEAVREANAIKRWLIRYCDKKGYSVKGIVGVSTNSAYAGTIKRKGSKKEYVPNGMPIPTVVEAHIHMVLFANPASTIVSDLKDYLNKKHMKVVAWDKHCNTREAVENGVNYAMRQSRKIRTIDYDRKDVLSVDEWGYYEAVEKAEARIKDNMAFTKSEPEQTPETLENKSVSSISDTPETLTYKSIKYNYLYCYLYCYIVPTSYNHSIIKVLLQNIIYYGRESSRSSCSKIIFKKVLLKVPQLLKNIELCAIIIMCIQIYPVLRCLIMTTIHSLDTLRKKETVDNLINSIICGDSVEVMRRLPANSVDLFITSPPYNLKNSTGNGMKDGRGGKWENAALKNGYINHSDDMPYDEYVKWQRACLKQMYRLLKDDGAIFYNHKWRVQAGVMQDRHEILKGFPVRQIIIWHRKGGINFNAGYFLPTYEVIYLIAKPNFKLAKGANKYGDVWEIMQENKNPHPAPFPEELIDRIVTSTNAQIIIDPFGGSGTTAVCAKKAGRSFINIDNSELYCEMARKRIDGEEWQK